MDEIYKNLLWIGHAFDLRQPKEIFDVGIQAVVDVAYEEVPAHLPRQLVYCRFPLMDGGGNEPKILLQTLRTITDLLNSNTPAIIACSAGMSRSPTVAAFALAHHLSESPESIYRQIAKLKSLELKMELWNDLGSIMPKMA